MFTTWLSDITTGDGRRITKSAWNGFYLDTDRRQNNAKWRLWETIDKHNVRLWTQALRNTFSESQYTVLTNPLGKWTKDVPSNWQ